MLLLLKKVFRDFLTDRIQTILAVLAMTLGIIVFGSVLVCYTIINRDLPNLHKVTNSHAIQINVDDVSPEMINLLEKSEHVARIEPSASISLMGNGEGRGSHNVFLFSYRNPANISINQYNLTQGEFCEESEIMLENLCFDVADVNLYENFLLPKADGSGNEVLKIVGGVHDISQHPANYHREVYGYVTEDTLRSMGYKVNRILITVVGDTYNLDNVEFRRKMIVEEFQNADIEINSADIPTFLGDSPHAHEYVPITAMIQVVGIVVYILATLMIINLLSTILSKQTKQIGVIKTIGGEKGKLIAIFSIVVFGISAGCLFIAAPLSIIIGRFLTSFLLGIGNYVSIDPSIPVQTLILILSASFCVPLSFSMLPILRSCRISIKDALNSYGITSSDNHRLQNSVFGKFSEFFSLAFRKSVRNIVINRKRIIASVLLLAIGGTVYLSSRIVISSLRHTIDLSSNNYKYNYEFMPSDNPQKVLDSSNIYSYEIWKRTIANIESSNGSVSENIYFNVPNINSTLYLPNISDGRWFVESDKNKVLISAQFSSANSGIIVGEYIDVIIGEKVLNCEIIGIVDDLGFQNNYILPTHETYEALQDLYIVKFRADDIKTLKTHIAIFEEELISSGISLNYSNNIRDSIASFESNSLVILNFFLNASLFIIIISGIGLASTMCILVLSRTKEIGILHSLGTTKKQINRMIFSEVTVIGFICLVITYLTTVPISFIINRIIGEVLFGVGLKTQILVNSFVIYFFVICGIVLFSSIAPTKLASRLSIKEALTYE